MVAKRRRKTVARKKTTVKKRSASKKRKTVKLNVEPAIAREIWAIIYFSVAAVTFLSLQDQFGVLGNFWVNMLQPVLGWGIYIIPVVFLFISAALFFAKKVHFGAARIFGFFLFMSAILSIFHLSIPVDQIYEFASRGSHGGYVGFVTNFLFLQVLQVGRIGATVIFVAALLISWLLILEVSLRTIVSYVVPDIQIEVASKKNDRQARSVKKKTTDDSDDGDKDEKPEIMIRKAPIGRNKSADDKIYEPETDESENDTEDKIPQPALNRADLNNLTDSLSRNQEQSSLLDDQDYEWEFPSLDLLKTGNSEVEIDEKTLMKNAELIREKLKQFGIGVTMHEVNVGPTVIQYTLKPNADVKLSKITSLKNDLALAIAAERIRIEAPIPGKSLVGIEIPNQYRAVVHLREILESAEFTDSQSKLSIPLGRDVTGKPIIANLESMPHLLIAGATGAGKSVGLNTFLVSLLYQNSPKELRFIMIDPKRVELSSYNNIPHLLSPVIENPEKAAIALKWVVSEMNRRYKDLSKYRVRNIHEFNELDEVPDMSRIIVVIDELADLMMVARKEVEASICRIAQMARAVGIHLIIATQRPSVDVITGLIKANIPARIAFAVSSSIDSRTILDGTGAEDLLGRGDMLYLPTGQNKPVRIQGIYVSTEEIERVTNRIRLTIAPDYNEQITSDAVARKEVHGVPDTSSLADEDLDAMYEEAVQLVRQRKKASASMFQRRLKIGYARAARIIDQLEAKGVVGPANGAKPRKILVD